jgi:hypothetical protein
MGHYMTDDEIIARYRTLKPQGRVKLLAELNGCACVEIEQVIGRYEMKSKIAGHEDDLRALHASGMTDKEIAAQVGVAPSTIYLWRKNCGLAPNAVRGGNRKSESISAASDDRLARQMLFLRGVAIGAGVKDIDKLLEAIT